MAIITVELIRTNPLTNFKIIESLGYIKTLQSSSNLRLPAHGKYEVDGREYDYLLPDGSILHDWVQIQGTSYGYYLALPYACPPCKIDPNAAPVLSGSAIQRAIDYYMANPGCSQSAAARVGGCAPSNLNARLKKLVNNP